MHKLFIVVGCLLMSLTALCGVKAADTDPAKAAYDMGDYARALAEWQPRAAHGDIKAVYGMGLLYEGGFGVDLDYGKAVSWYRKAAEQGYAPAQEKLGSYYHFGIAGEQDDVKAAAWEQKAAEQGFAEAEYSLGSFYDHGQGVPHDAVKAANWYKKAAEQGHASAIDNLGLLYLGGTGVAQDTATGATLLFIARRIGDEDERNAIDEILAKLETQHRLSSEQSTTAEAAASRWKPGTPLPIPAAE